MKTERSLRNRDFTSFLPFLFAFLQFKPDSQINMFLHVTCDCDVTMGTGQYYYYAIRVIFMCRSTLST